MRNDFFKIAVIVFMLSNGSIIKAQYVKVEEFAVFGNRIKEPIQTDVQQNQGRISFNVINKSYYPYEVEIVFEHMTNLSPKYVRKKIIAERGRNPLFVLDIVDKEQSPDYSYTISYQMGSDKGNADLSIPYLLPIGEHKIVKLALKSGTADTTYLIDHFRMKRGDSVFCIRKGYVTALPDNNTEIDRIQKTSSLEILHSDGTVAVYNGFDQNLNFLSLGQIVYPGQMIGRIGSGGLLILNLYQFQGSGKLKSLEIYYVNTDGQLISSRRVLNATAVYPESVIKKELSKKEASKFDRGSLY